MEKSKKEIRRECLARRNELTEEERSLQSQKNVAWLLTSNCFQSADAILLYASYGSEADTNVLFAQAITQGKAVYYPKVETLENQEKMIFYRVEKSTDLVSGYKGIPEPIGNTQEYRFHPQDRVLMIMPGAAFDFSHNRIGYGKGFYDRFLAVYPELLLYTIAIGFTCQLVGEIPADEYDCKPAGILLSGELIGEYYD